MSTTTGHFFKAFCPAYFKNKFVVMKYGTLFVDNLCLFSKQDQGNKRKCQARNQSRGTTCQSEGSFLYLIFVLTSFIIIIWPDPPSPLLLSVLHFVTNTLSFLCQSSALSLSLSHSDCLSLNTFRTVNETFSFSAWRRQRLQTRNYHFRLVLLFLRSVS